MRRHSIRPYHEHINWTNTRTYCTDKKYATYQLNNRTFSTQNTKISARSLAISYICFQVRIVKLKKKRERKKSHTINYYGKIWWLPHPRAPTRALYTRNCNWRNYSFYHSWRPSWMPLFAENSRALWPLHPARGPKAAPGPHLYEKNRMFQTHTHNWIFGLLAIIYNSFFSSFWSVCKTFFRRKSTHNSGSLLSARSISFFSSFLCSSQYNKQDHNHECYEHSHGHIVPTNSDLSTMYDIEIWEELYVFQRRYI